MRRRGRLQLQRAARAPYRAAAVRAGSAAGVQPGERAGGRVRVGGPQMRRGADGRGADGCRNGTWVGGFSWGAGWEVPLKQAGGVGASPVQVGQGRGGRQGGMTGRRACCCRWRCSSQCWGGGPLRRKAAWRITPIKAKRGCGSVAMWHVDEASATRVKPPRPDPQHGRLRHPHPAPPCPRSSRPGE